MKRVLAFDLALKVGWAHSADPAGYRTGVQAFPTPEARSAARRVWVPGDRWVAFTPWLSGLVERVQPEAIVYEAPLLSTCRNADSAAVAFGMATRVQEIAARLRIPVSTVNNSTLKLWATGDGHAQKPAMIAAAERLAGSAFASDDEADAFLLMLHWLGEVPPAARPERLKRRRRPHSQPSLTV